MAQWWLEVSQAATPLALPCPAMCESKGTWQAKTKFFLLEMSMCGLGAGPAGVSGVGVLGLLGWCQKQKRTW